MHVSNFVVAAATTTSAAAKRAGVKADGSVPGAAESTSAERAAAQRECNVATANKREATWMSKSLARIAAAWPRRSRPE